MLIASLTLVVFAVLALLFWILRGMSPAQELPPLHRIDTLAFRNLLSETDEQYLRISLSEANYRQVRRSRVRAVQQYLSWIADDCAVLLAMMRAVPLPSSQASEGMALRAVQMRLISLSLWAALWLEYLIPSVEIKPQKAIRRYEEFWRSAEMYVTRRPQPAS